MVKILTVLYFVALGFMFVLAYVGMFYTGNFWHEASHRADMNLIADDGYICVLEIPDSANITWKNWFSGKIASYNYYVNKSEYDEMHRIREYTEWKAYSMDALLAVFFIVAFLIIGIYKINQHWDRKKELAEDEEPEEYSTNLDRLGDCPNR